MEKFELIVIGGGPAGYLAAERAAHKGLSVLLIEKNQLGGVCLNEGCIPSKTLLNSAKALSYFSHANQYGITFEGSAKINQKSVVEKKNRVVRKLVGGVKLQLKNAGVTVLSGEAKIKERRSDGFVVSVDSDDFLGNNLILASGSAPVIPTIKGLNQALSSGFAVTNREILNQCELPDSLIIVGGGVIGLEMAQYFSTVGVVVTVVEMLDKIAANTDYEVSTILQKSLEKNGVVFCLGAKVIEISEDGIVYQKEGETVKISAQKVLLSIGRKPVIENLGLENIGVEIERGIKTDDCLKTNIDNLYACGDCNGKVMLAHTAYREAEVAVNNICNIPDKINYNAIPSIIYTNPEVACVGETEETAAQKGIDYLVAKLPMTYSGRYVAESLDQTGICKLIIDKTANCIIGAHVIGLYASELILAVSSLIDLKIDIERIKKLVFPHPTVGEIIKEVLFSL